MGLRSGIVAAIVVTLTATLPARADLILDIDGPFTINAGSSQLLSVFVTDDGNGGPTTLTDLSLKLLINVNAAVAPNGLQFDSNSPNSYATSDPNYVFFTVSAGPSIVVNPSPASVGPYQEVTISDFDIAFNGVTLSGKQLIAQVVLTTLPSDNDPMSGAAPASPGDLFTINYDLGFSNFNGGPPFSVSGDNNGQVSISNGASVPEPATIGSLLVGAAVALAAWRRKG